MLEFSGVALTDEVNLYGHRFSIEGLYSSYADIWDEGVPSFLNHDHRKHLGWTKLSGLYVEPQKVYLMNSIYVGENEKENNILKERSYQQLFHRRVVEQQEKYNALKSKLGDILSNSATPCWVNAVSYNDKDIVRRAIPSISSSIVKGLIPIKELNYIQPGIYEKEGWLIFAHKYFRRGFSYLNTLNEPFLELLQSLSENHTPQVAIDLDCIGLLGTQSKEFEYSYWWGPKFNDDLSFIPNGVTVYENQYYDGLLSDVLRTEFGWYIQDDIKTFECEEITDIPNINTGSCEKYGCRFVHSMINQKTGMPNHLDGAVRGYSTEQMVSRLEIDIRHTERHTEYTKLWRIDGDIDIVSWKSLICHYYRDNMQAGEYFNGSDEKLDLTHREKSNILPTPSEFSIKSFIPVNMKSGDGLRINIKCANIENIQDNFDILVRPVQFFANAKNIIKFIESDTITIIKYLVQQQLKVRVPFCKKIATEDMVYNFPVFVCKDVSCAKHVVECFEKLCNAWYEKGDDRLLSYSLQINYCSYSVLFSFAGHIEDFRKFYMAQKGLPESESDIAEWLDKSYAFLNTYESLTNQPSHVDLKGKNGILAFPKVFVDSKYIEKIEPDEKGIVVGLKLTKEQLEVIQKNGIWVCCMFEVENSSCSICKLPYENCPCIKFIDSKTTEQINKGNFIGVLWTNRSAMCFPPKLRARQ